MFFEFIYLFPPVISFLCVIVLVIDGHYNMEKTEIYMGIGLMLFFLQTTIKYIYNIGFMHIYYFLDVINQYILLLLFPLFRAYVCRLSRENALDFKSLWKLFLAPHIWIVMYIIGVIIIPEKDYRIFLYGFDHNISFQLPALAYLQILLHLRNILFFTIGIWVIVSNLLMVKKYYMASNYDSEILDSTPTRVNAVNLMSIFIFVLLILSMLPNFGRISIWSNLISDILMAICFILFTCFGVKQKIPIPYQHQKIIEKTEEKLIQATENTDAKNVIKETKTLGQKIEELFITDKIYTNMNLNLQILAERIGINRTYLSQYFNNDLGVNFCSYVNKYRVDELEHIIQKHPDYSIEILADVCGFGSVDSLKRAVQKIRQEKYTKWRQNILIKKTEEI